MLHDARKLRRSFKHSFAGLALAWRDELNFRIQTIFSIVVIAASVIFRISAFDFLLIILTLCLMLAAEVFNTALEEVCDKIQPSHDPHIGRIKDLAAGAVLITSLPAFVITVVILLPYALRYAI
jgi:diacylglycerol kinase (ATP)